MGDREHEDADNNRQRDDCYAEITEQVEQPEQYGQERNGDEPEPAPIDRIIEIGDANLVGVGAQFLKFLGSCKQPRCLRSRFASFDRSQLCITHIRPIISVLRFEFSLDRNFLVGDQCSQPIFVGHAVPPAGGGKAYLAVGRFGDLIIAPVIIRFAVEYTYRANVNLGENRSTLGGVFGFAFAADDAEGRDIRGR